MLIQILSLMAVAIVAATLFGRLGLGAILGYLVGGVVIGPWGLGLVTDTEQIAHVGEFGVVFLLFLIGIGLKPSRLWVMRRQILGLGSGQLLITGLLLSALVYVSFGLEPGPAILVGLGLALSSTAIGLQMLASRNLLGQRWGRSGFSILLFQDMAVVPLLALVPLLAQEEITFGASVGIALLKTLVLLVGAIVVGRFAINPLFRVIAASKTPEVFTAFTVLLVLTFGWFMQSIGLSMAMGGFVAGLLMSGSEFRHQVEVDIQPLRGLLLGLFFMSIGMGLNLEALAGYFMLIIVMLVIMLALKIMCVCALARFSSHTFSESLKLGFLLAQAGEFGFVLFAYARSEGVLGGSLVEALMVVIALSMALTPLLFMAGRNLAARYSHKEEVAGAYLAEELDADKQVVIAGFGRVGETIARMLTALDIPFIVVDLDPVNVKRAINAGFDAVFGDAGRSEILRSVGVERAALLVITIDNRMAAERLIISLKAEYPDLPILVRCHNAVDAARLRKLGAMYTVPETLEASLSLGAEVARRMEVADSDITGILQEFRSDDYSPLMTDEVLLEADR